MIKIMDDEDFDALEKFYDVRNLKAFYNKLYQFYGGRCFDFDAHVDNFVRTHKRTNTIPFRASSNCIYAISGNGREQYRLVTYDYEVYWVDREGNYNDTAIPLDNNGNTDWDKVDDIKTRFFIWD